jgi:hypothetical protein
MLGPVTGTTARDDRSWPRWARPFSAVALVAALVVGVWAVVTASEGKTAPWVVALASVVVLAVGARLFAAAFRARIEGGEIPGRSRLGELALVVLGFAALVYDGRLAAGVWSGLLAAVFATNLWAIRRARANRDLVDAAEAARDRALEQQAREADTRHRDEVVRADEPPLDVAAALLEAAAGSRRRWLAWALATALVSAGTFLLTDSGLARFMIPFVGTCFLLWSSLSLWAAWRARRDFAAAKHPPQRAYVVLLHDPAPRMIRPLLGVWRERPAVREGALPKPELVFRCDEDVDDLVSHQGSAVVHEAWVDTSARGMRGARWVAGESGIALPHHRGWLFGRWYLHALTRGERPDPPKPLRSPSPHPDRTPAPTPPTHAETGATASRSVRAAGWRTAGLAVLAALCVVVD